MINYQDLLEGTGHHGAMCVHVGRSIMHATRSLCTARVYAVQYAYCNMVETSS